MLSPRYELRIDSKCVEFREGWRGEGGGRGKRDNWTDMLAGMKTEGGTTAVSTHFARFQSSTLPFVINNGMIYSFSINEMTGELLYSDLHGVHLVTLSENEVVKSIPYTDMIKQELTRYSDRKQQEIVQLYASHGVQSLNAVHHLNIWLGVVSRKKFVFFSDELLVSNESPIDISGITSIRLDRESGDIFTLTGEGKVMIWSCEIISDAGKKRVEFDVKIAQKKTFSLDSDITKFDMTSRAYHHLAAIADSPSNNIATVYLWNYSTGERLPAVQHSEGYSPVSIIAIGVKGNYLAALDVNKVMVVRDIEAGTELHRRSLYSLVYSVDHILFEDIDLSSGIYIIESTGRVIDYSSTGGILSAYSHSKYKEVDTRTSRIVDRVYITGLRMGQLDEKAPPGSLMSKYNTTYAIVTRFTGLKQLWALYDGTMDVVNLASIGQMVRFDGRVLKAYRLPYTPGVPWAFPIQGISEISIFQTQLGTLHLINPVTEQKIGAYTGSQSGVGLYAISLEMTSVVTMSPSGQLSCLNFQTNVASQGYQLSKLVVTSLCIAPKHPPGTSQNASNETDVYYIVMGTDSGVILVFEYSPRHHGIELKKRYAAHDVVILVAFRYWERKVMTVGRDGYVKFLLCDNYYEWDSVGYKGFWSDCSACGMCGHSMVVLGYESGMLQTLYFSPSADYPISSLLEYHTTAITTASGLDLSLAEAASSDESGQIVLWNLERNEPLKVFRVHSCVEAVAITGNPNCESLYIVFQGSVLKLRIDRETAYKRVTRREVVAYKAEIKRKRMDLKKKGRPSGMHSNSSKRLRPETQQPPRNTIAGIRELYAHVTSAKQKLEHDPIEEARLQAFRNSEDEMPSDRPTRRFFTDIQDRKIGQIIEDKRLERFKRSLALTIRHVNVLIPREVLFGRLKTKKMMVSPLRLPVTAMARSMTTRGQKMRKKEKMKEYVYETESLLEMTTRRFGFLSDCPSFPIGSPSFSRRSVPRSPRTDLLKSATHELLSNKST